MSVLKAGPALPFFAFPTLINIFCYTVFMEQLYIFVDPVLIAPYRWLGSALAGWWLGTLFLALWTALLSELTLGLAYYLNRRAVKEKSEKMMDYFKASVAARKEGDQSSYKSINKLANEYYGQSFFLQMAMGMGSLWPAFLAAGWLQMRFGEIRFALPLVDFSLGFVAPFIILYIPARILFSRLKRPLLSYIRRSREESRAGGPGRAPAPARQSGPNPQD